MSVMPPGANATTTVTGWSGYSARAAPAATLLRSSALSAPRRRILRFMVVSWGSYRPVARLSMRLGWASMAVPNALLHPKYSNSTFALF
ncbi:hypothetical protein D3C78_1641990 [compost metagenome]